MTSIRPVLWAHEIRQVLVTGARCIFCQVVRAQAPVARAQLPPLGDSLDFATLALPTTSFPTKLFEHHGEILASSQRSSLPRSTGL